MDNKADIVWRIFRVTAIFAAMAIAFLVLSGKAMTQPLPCVNGGTPMGDVAGVIELLEERYGETARFMGVVPKKGQRGSDPKDSFFMLLVNPNNGSWTMGYYQDPAQFCGMVSGKGGFLIEFESIIPGRDA